MPGGTYGYAIYNQRMDTIRVVIVLGFVPPAIDSSSTCEMAGSIVLVRMLSMFRAPLSTSVQRSATASITASSSVRRIPCVSSRRR